MSHGSREREVFDAVHAALPHERPALIAELCGDDAELAARVRRLLVADLAAAPLDVSPLAAIEREPTRIGQYDIVGRIGEGGMGVVYLADQTSPVRRRVALKVIRPGMDSREVVARFEAERQALALMTHPNIARIIDGGTTDDGRPYFVMEHAPGAPLIRWCDQHVSAIDERLELFVQVCNALQHAHQKGVVHRDLKPSNVIVTELDGRPVPKVIDFGIAKAIGQPLAESGAQTRIGHLIGTPDYMSPEQFEWSAHDVDTRADVYALGVLLYELLAGTLPFDFQARRLSLAEIEAEVRQRDPPPPSVAARAADAEVIAARGMRDGPDLANQLTGDLDWIVAKAMAKERERRYASTRELAADLERHLANQPVSAGPPSGWYVLAKFARRNILPVSLLATTFALTVAFAVLMAVQLRETAREHDRANLEAAKAREVSRFLTEMFEGSDPESGSGASVTAREILDRGARRVRTEFDNQPELRAELLAVTGRAYDSLGSYPEALAAYEEALATLEKTGDAATERAFALHERAAFVLEATGDAAVAERRLRDALLRAEREHGRDSQVVQSLRVQLGYVLRRAATFDQAEQILQQALLAIPHAGVSGTALHVNAQLELAYLRIDKGQLKDAEALLTEALVQARTVFTPYEYRLLVALERQTTLQLTLGDATGAERTARELLQLADQAFGPDSRMSANAHSDLGNALAQRGDLAGGLVHVAKAYDILVRLLGPENRNTATALNNLGYLKLRVGDVRGARRDLEAVVANRLAALGEHPDTASSMLNLGRTYLAEGDAKAAIRILRHALDIDTRILGPEAWRTANIRRYYGEALARTGEDARAARELAAAHAALLKALGPEHARTRDAQEALARLSAKPTTR